MTDEMPSDRPLALTYLCREYAVREVVLPFNICTTIRQRKGFRPSVIVELYAQFQVCPSHRRTRAVATRDPTFSVDKWAEILFIKEQAETERFIGALRKAGLN